ncbi:MAG: hypothetical protein ACLS9A_06515 [Clostridia bacterium]
MFECTWIRELDDAQNDKVEEEYLPPYQFNGILVNMVPILS